VFLFSIYSGTAERRQEYVAEMETNQGSITGSGNTAIKDSNHRKMKVRILR